MEVLFLVIPLLVAVGIAIRLALGRSDHERIRQYVEGRGGEIMESNWAPFGPGWFGEKSDRIYNVRYLDKERSVHAAHCKTSMWTGVYFTEDRIVLQAKRPAPPPTASETELGAENRRLRAELERVRRQGSAGEPSGPRDGED